jgi:hypothetical protein
MGILQKMVAFLIVYGLAVQVSAQKADSGAIKRSGGQMSFSSDNSEWSSYLLANIRTGKIFSEGKAPAGRYKVRVKFTVDTTGQLSNFVPLTHYGFGMEEELIRVMKGAAPWQPANQGGRPVRSYHVQSFNFMSYPEVVDIITEPYEGNYVLLATLHHTLTVQPKGKRIKQEDIELVVDSATVVPKGGGQFMLRVEKPGGVLVKVMQKGRTEPVEVIHFEVKALQKPIGRQSPMP